MTSLAELRRDLRTREAIGEGTDTRLVLLEAAMVAGRMDVLDDWIRRLAGRRAPRGYITDRNGLQVALRDDDPIFHELARVWEGVNLQEVTERLREVDDLLELLLYGSDDGS